MAQDHELPARSFARPVTVHRGWKFAPQWGSNPRLHARCRVAFAIATDNAATKGGVVFCHLNYFGRATHPEIESGFAATAIRPPLQRCVSVMGTRPGFAPGPFRNQGSKRTSLVLPRA